MTRWKFGVAFFNCVGTLVPFWFSSFSVVFEGLSGECDIIEGRCGRHDDDMAW